MQAPPYSVIDALYPGADKDMGNPHVMSMHLTVNKEWICTIGQMSNWDNEYDLLILDMKYNTIAKIPIYGNIIYKTFVFTDTESNSADVLVIHSDQNNKFLMVSYYSKTGQKKIYELNKICALGYMSEFDTIDKEFIKSNKSRVLVKSKYTYICICNNSYFSIHLGLERDHALEMFDRERT